MANRELPIPIRGVSEALPVDKAAPLTSGYMNNVRPIDVLEKRIRIGQRPGLDKAFDQQIGGASSPILLITTVSIID
jgi:hypothetical protein